MVSGQLVGRFLRNEMSVRNVPVGRAYIHSRTLSGSWTKNSQKCPSPKLNGREIASISPAKHPSSATLIVNHGKKVLFLTHIFPPFLRWNRQIAKCRPRRDDVTRPPFPAAVSIGGGLMAALSARVWWVMTASDACAPHIKHAQATLARPTPRPQPPPLHIHHPTPTPFRYRQFLQISQSGISRAAGKITPCSTFLRPVPGPHMSLWRSYLADDTPTSRQCQKKSLFTSSWTGLWFSFAILTVTRDCYLT